MVRCPQRAILPDVPVVSRGLLDICRWHRASSFAFLGLVDELLVLTMRHGCWFTCPSCWPACGSVWCCQLFYLTEFLISFVLVCAVVTFFTCPRSWLALRYLALLTHYVPELLIRFVLCSAVNSLRARVANCLTWPSFWLALCCVALLTHHVRELLLSFVLVYDVINLPTCASCWLALC